MNTKNLLGNEAFQYNKAQDEKAALDETIAALKKEIDELKAKGIKAKTKPDREETTIRQQLLILYYLGFIDSLPIETKEKKYELLAVLLNRGHAGIKEAYHLDDVAHLFDVKTETNLEFVFDLFQKTGLTEAAERVRKELEPIKVKKL